MWHWTCFTKGELFYVCRLEPVILFAFQLPTSNRAIAKPVSTFARHALGDVEA